MNAKLKTLFSGIVAVSCAMILSFSCSSPSTSSSTDDNNIPSIPGVDTPVDGLSSIQFASAMQSGWNLGNTFDANSVGSKENKGNNYETSWGMPKTTKKMINTVADKGFKTIRIPISWHNHITDGTNYTIDPGWLARVKEVVDWARDNKMFVIINIHHDNLKSAEMSTTYGFSVNTNTSENDASKVYIEKIWTQVATYFKDYDNHVIFEVLNEPRNMDLQNAFNPTSAEESECNAVIKEYEQVALDAIRATGGNNANRFIMVPYYAASPWKNDNWSLPTDSATDKLLISTHAYDPYSFAMYNGSVNTDFKEAEEGNELTTLFNNLKTKWVDNGRGVVMGEASCTDKNNLSDREAWFNSYIPKAKAIHCPVVLWDNMQTASTSNDIGERHGYLNRNTCTWIYPTLVNAMVSTAGGSVDGYSGSSPSSGSDPASGSSGSSTAIWTGSQDLKHWDGADGITLAASKFTSATSTSKLRFTITIGADCTATDSGSGDPCSNNYSSIHPITAWSDGNINFSEANAQKQLSVSPTSTATTVTITPDAASWSTIKTKGLIIYGHKVVITKIELM